MVPTIVINTHILYTISAQKSIGAANLFVDHSKLFLWESNLDILWWFQNNLEYHFASFFASVFLHPKIILHYGSNGVF